MKKRTLATILTLISLIATAAAGVAPATASPTIPTAGDRILYVFVSDVPVNESATWFDEDNEIEQFTSTNLPTYDADSDLWTGTVRVESASTTQFAASTFQTSGHYAGCRIWVNDTLVAENAATGLYAVATC